MSPRTLKLRARRLWRRRTSQVEGIGQQAGEQFERNFLARLERLRHVWRFTLLWMLLFLLLAGGLIVQFSNLKGYYQTLQPVPGGMYSEGLQGSFTTANPLYAVSDVDTSVAKLLFSSLLTYGSDNTLTGDLADRWSVDTTGTVYTVHLRPGLTWQDGQPLTSDDVVFTYQTIQDPDVQSPLLFSWQGVKVASVDSRTVTFTLPNPLSSFPYSLTNGIVPKHILGKVNVVDLRSADFNTVSPVGSGPFTWGTIGVSGSGDNLEEQISLLPFNHYWAGMPRLSSFSIYAFASRDDLIAAYQDKEIMAVVGLDSIPAAIAKDTSSHVYSLPLTAGVFVFFKTSNPVLNDVKVRQALVAAADRDAIIKQLGYTTTPVDEPLLKHQLGYDPAFAQATGNRATAQALLDAAGWHVDAHGIRTKGNQELSFTLSATNNSEYAAVAHKLIDEWRSVGVNAQLSLQLPADFQGALARHQYDAVLYGISIGTDPDVFVYWDSSQADVRATNQLNFSEYKSSASDVALEAGRTRQDPILRAAKYRVFLQAWQKDTPALGLYQPTLLYIAHTPVYGLQEHAINTDAARFDNVQDWMIHLGWVTRP